MSIAELQEQLIDDFSFFTDWTEKYEHIIQLGKELPLIEPAYKTDDNLIRGCQSQVWLHADYQDGKVVFTADSDAIITKGLISMLVAVLSGHTAQEIVQSEIYFIEKIGLNSHLSSTRSNGLMAMLKQIKMYALAFTSKQND